MSGIVVYVCLRNQLTASRETPWITAREVNTRSKLPHLYQPQACHKCKSQLGGAEFAGPEKKSKVEKCRT